MPQDSKLLLCRLGEIWYGMDLARVQEIIFRPKVIPLPTMGASVAGIMEWMGQQMAVVDMADHGAGLPEGQAFNSKPVVVIKENGSIIGLLTDEIGEIITMEANKSIEIDPLLKSSVGTVRDAFEYRGEMIFTIDPNELFSSVR